MSGSRSGKDQDDCAENRGDDPAHMSALSWSLSGLLAEAALAAKVKTRLLRARLKAKGPVVKTNGPEATPLRGDTPPLSQIVYAS